MGVWLLPVLDATALNSLILVWKSWNLHGKAGVHFFGTWGRIDYHHFTAFLSFFSWTDRLGFHFFSHNVEQRKRHLFSFVCARWGVLGRPSGAWLGLGMLQQQHESFSLFYGRKNESIDGWRAQGE